MGVHADGKLRLLPFASQGIGDLGQTSSGTSTFSRSVSIPSLTRS